MSITSLNGVLAGFAQTQFFLKSIGTPVSPRLLSSWLYGGIPGPGSVNTTLNGGVYSSTSALVNGQIPHYDPVSGSSYLSRFQLSASGAGGTALLCDRIWDNGGITITSTSLQTIASPTWPARDSNGLTAGTGIFLGVEVSATTGAGTPTLTVGYTNSVGTASRTGTNFDATAASVIAGSFFRIGVQGNDQGVQSVQSLTLSATWTSGTINLVAYRVMAILDMATSQGSWSIDAVTSGFPQIFNGTVPFVLFIPTANNATTLTGVYQETQG
jgi:hypothetical protein